MEFGVSDSAVHGADGPNGDVSVGGKRVEVFGDLADLRIPVLVLKRQSSSDGLHLQMTVTTLNRCMLSHCPHFEIAVALPGAQRTADSLDIRRAVCIPNRDISLDIGETCMTVLGRDVQI